jgi:hypothetical protein
VLRLLAIVAVLSLALGLATSAHAADPVTNANDSGPGSLRNALATASAGQTIEIPPGTYSLTSGQLVVNANNLTLRNQPGASKPTIQSTGNFRVLCINAPNEVTLEGLIVHGGHAAPGSGADCADSQGGGIHAENGTILNVQDSVVQHNTAAPAQGGGGGIFAAGDLFVQDSIVRDNSTTAGLTLGNNNGGGGIRWTGSGFPSFEITDSSIYGNTATVGGTGSGGGGVYSSERPTLTNVTFSGNSHVAGAGAAAGGGGGGILVQTGGGSIEHATFFGNHSDRDGGALGGSSTSLENSVFAGNTAQSNPDCGTGTGTSLGGNVSTTAAPCGFGANDKGGVDPQLGPLDVNGSNNGTLTHAILARTSPAVEFPINCPVANDQRGVSRSQFGACDSGAYEFDGKTSADVPDCSPTGVIPLALDSAPGGTVVGLSYKVDGGAEIDKNTGDSGQPLTSTSVTFPEGRATLEYWGRWTNGVEQGHGAKNVLVDKTQPTVDVERTDGESIFVITRRETVTVHAADALSGLVQDPSGNAVPVDTRRRGAASFTPTAADLCQNQASDEFDYRVLAPGLGVRTVLERVRGRVRVRRRAAGAVASQNGQSFSPLTQPRELPVGSFIDARKGTTRLTSARTRREDQIQDGRFAGGVFQVRQSRKTRAKGLTDLRLKGGNFKRCGRRAKAGTARAALSRRAIRRLRGSASGRFRTSGRNSSATVRGTAWEVVDRCDGTLTKVTRGRVVVRDFRRHRTVIVRAGKSYLARAPG